MKIAIVGASGALGGAVVRAALAAGHEVTAVVRSAVVNPPAGVTWRFADAVSRRGLRAALTGADTVIDALNSSKPRLLALGTRALLETATELGIGHYVGISVVGCDRMPIGYYRGKLEQEALVAASSIGWSLLRATQLHGFVDAMFAKGVLGIHFVPRRALVQPVAVDEVAAALVAAAVATPGGRLPDFGGPELLRMDDAFRLWRQARRAGGILLPLPLPGALGRSLAQGGLCNPDRAVGRQTYSEWLRGRRRDAIDWPSQAAPRGAARS